MPTIINASDIISPISDKMNELCLNLHTRWPRTTTTYFLSSQRAQAFWLHYLGLGCCQTHPNIWPYKRLLIQIKEKWLLYLSLALNYLQSWQSCLTALWKGKCVLSLWKLSIVCCVFKNAGKHSSPLQYHPIDFLSIISKHFDFIINKEVVNHLTRNNLLSNK